MKCFANIEQAKQHLDEYLRKTLQKRQQSVGSSGWYEAIEWLGPEAGIAWLEAHIESPCDGSWGSMLSRFNPSWQVLHRWIHQGKLHCLAAIDALILFGDPHDSRGFVTTPEGADAKLINDAMDYALATHLNPRLENAAKEIRQAWPRGGRKRKPVAVPPALLDAAEIVLGFEPDMVRTWRERMENAKRVPRKLTSIWESLLDFAQRVEFVWSIDHRESPTEVFAAVRSLKGAAGLEVNWDQLAGFAGNTESALKAIGNEIAKSRRVLVCLDRGGDDYPLAVFPADTLPRLAALLDSLGDSDIRVVSFS